MNYGRTIKGRPRRIRTGVMLRRASSDYRCEYELPGCGEILAGDPYVVFSRSRMIGRKLTWYSFKECLSCFERSVETEYGQTLREGTP